MVVKDQNEKGRAKIKIVAGYVGTVVGLRKLIQANLLDYTPKSIPYGHLNHHGYMEGRDKGAYVANYSGK